MKQRDEVLEAKGGRQGRKKELAQKGKKTFGLSKGGLGKGKHSL